MLRCVGATETEPGRSGERKEGASGDAEAAACESLPPPETRPGAGRLPEVGSGNFLQESQKSWWNILERLFRLSRNCSDYSPIVQIIQILPAIHNRYCFKNPDTVRTKNIQLCKTNI